MDIEKTAKRLLTLSENIDKEFLILEDLSYHSREDSSEYQKHFNALKDYLYKETIILNNTKLENLNDIYFDIVKMELPGDDAYDRCLSIINDRIDELLPPHEYRRNDENPLTSNILGMLGALKIPDYDEEEEELEDDDLEDEKENFYVDEDGIENYKNYIIERNAIIAISKMESRINGTFAENKNESKYKLALIKNLKRFKYYFYRTNRTTELLGIKTNFDITKLPYYKKLDKDLQRISYNECVMILEFIYSTDVANRAPYDVLEVLYAFIRFEEHLKDITDKSLLEALINYCYVLGTEFKDSYYGKIGYNLLIKKQTNN